MITAQDFVDALNNHGIDTPAKANRFVAIAAPQVERAGLSIQLAALSKQAEDFGTQQASERAVIQAKIAQQEQLIVTALAAVV